MAAIDFAPQAGWVVKECRSGQFSINLYPTQGEVATNQLHEWAAGG